MSVRIFHAGGCPRCANHCSTQVCVAFFYANSFSFSCTFLISGGSIFSFPMANYCSNSVLFLGDPAAVNAIRDLFADIEQKQARTNRYYLPDFVIGDNGHMLDITFNEGWINYQSRWKPNLDLLVQLASRYRLDFISSFDEMTNWIYGEAVYQNAELKTVYRIAYEDEDLSTDTELAAIREEQKFILEKYAGPGYGII